MPPVARIDIDTLVNGFPYTDGEGFDIVLMSAAGSHFVLKGVAIEKRAQSVQHFAVATGGLPDVVRAQTQPQLDQVDASSINLAATGRDRIVLLGPRQAGKTVYLAVLYHTLWTRVGSLSLVALDGGIHTSCMETFAALRRGEWPARTAGHQYPSLEVRWHGETWPMVSLDYSGEVLRKAFGDRTKTKDARALLEHLDRAAAVIALVDPAAVVGESVLEASDDDFGMLKALERIRESPGGQSVPVAFVLTKYDSRKALIRKNGGTVAFVKRWYRQLLWSARCLKVFVVAAAPESMDDGAPSLRRTGFQRGVVKPLQFVVERLHTPQPRNQVESSDQALIQSSDQALIESMRRSMADAERERVRVIRFWTLFGFAFAAIAGVLWLATKLGIGYL
jgi:double-GTPase-like protein